MRAKLISRISPAAVALALVACSDGTGPEDDVAPQVNIISPADGSVVTTATVTVNGVASDNVRVTRVEYGLSLNSLTRLDIDPAASVGFSFTVPLAIDTNGIYVVARDASGNQSYNALVVLRVPPPR